MLPIPQPPFCKGGFGRYAPISRVIWVSNRVTDIYAKPSPSGRAFFAHDIVVAKHLRYKKKRLQYWGRFFINYNI